MVFVWRGTWCRVPTGWAAAGCAQLRLARLRQSRRHLPAGGFPVSLLVNAEMYRHAPKAIAAIPGAEIVGHGRGNSERQGGLTKHEERLLIEETMRAIEKHSGHHPRGWLGPWISQSPLTPDLLQEAGYHYLLDWCHDDQPVWMKT